MHPHGKLFPLQQKSDIVELTKWAAENLRNV